MAEQLEDALIDETEKRYQEARRRIAVSWFDNVVRARFLEVFDRVDEVSRRHRADAHGVAVASLGALAAEMEQVAQKQEARNTLDRLLAGKV